MLFVNVIENGFRIWDFSIDNSVSFVPIITYTHIHIYITLQLANSQYRERNKQSF